MDPDQAQILFEHGAILVLLDLPEAAEFGIDQSSWSVGPSFRGLKMIPAGIHFIHLSVKNRDGQSSPRVGFFHNFSPKEMLVKKWDVLSEGLSQDPIPEEELERYQVNRMELDKFLGPYPYDKYKQWLSMSNHITPDLLALVQPDCGLIYSMDQFESQASTTQSRRAAALLEAMETDQSLARKTKLPQLKKVAGTGIKYTHIPRKKHPEGCTPTEVSKYNLDSSYTLEQTLTERFGHDIYKLLGEVQLAFICFVIGQNYDSFEQWKKLVHLLCSSGEAMAKHQDAFSCFISMLHFQVKEIPSDFFVDIVSCNNFLTTSLHELFLNLQADQIDAKLAKKGLSFQKHVTDKFQWDFTSEPDDCAPVIVDS